MKTNQQSGIIKLEIHDDKGDVLGKPYWWDSGYHTVTPKTGKGKDRTSHWNYTYEDDFDDIL